LKQNLGRRTGGPRLTGRVKHFGDVGQHCPFHQSSVTVGLYARSQRERVRTWTPEYSQRRHSARFCEKPWAVIDMPSGLQNFMGASPFAQRKTPGQQQSLGLLSGFRGFLQSVSASQYVIHIHIFPDCECTQRKSMLLIAGELE